MLTADQKHAIRRLIPKMEDFINGECCGGYATKQIQNCLCDAFENGSSTGMVQMEVFTLDNVEGMRVQYGNAVKYFKVKSEGK